MNKKQKIEELERSLGSARMGSHEHWSNVLSLKVKEKLLLAEIERLKAAHKFLHAENHEAIDALVDEVGAAHGALEHLAELLGVDDEYTDVDDEGEFFDPLAFIEDIEDAYGAARTDAARLRLGLQPASGDRENE